MYLFFSKEGKRKMRSVIKIQTSHPKEGIQGSVQLFLGGYWKVPNETNKVEKLIDRVFPDYADNLRNMNNFALSHIDISQCDLLISYNEDEIQIRIFHDHIETLRELTGKLFKEFYEKILKQGKMDFRIKEILISEGNKNNVLDRGIGAVKRFDYIKKALRDKRSEIFFFAVVVFVVIFLVIYIVDAYQTGKTDNIFYELITKIPGPFMASALLTITNIVIYYTNLRSKTNIIWGVNTTDEE
jgi:hypothetical protein